MNLQTKALSAAILAGLFVVGASYGVSALVAPHLSHHTEAAQSTGSTKAMAAEPPSQLVETGRSLYTAACASCHGNNAQGGYGPNLYGLNLPNTQVATVIKNGVTGKMPGFGGKYNAAQQQALVAYVQSLKK